MALAMHQLKAILYTSYTSAVLSICMLWAAMQTNLGASAHGCLTPVMHHAVLASNLYAVDSFANLAGERTRTIKRMRLNNRICHGLSTIFLTYSTALLQKFGHCKLSYIAGIAR
eukprot:scaffold48679_cov17-Tisochrysis_lutea.AAC.1